jgi:hypothetical protein
MRFIVDADLPRSTIGLLGRYGHEAIDVRDIGLREASDGEIAAHAQSKGLCLIVLCSYVPFAERGKGRLAAVSRPVAWHPPVSRPRIAGGCCPVDLHVASEVRAIVSLRRLRHSRSSPWPLAVPARAGGQAPQETAAP